MNVIGTVTVTVTLTCVTVFETARLFRLPG